MLRPALIEKLGPDDEDATTNENGSVWCGPESIASLVSTDSSHPIIRQQRQDGPIPADGARSWCMDKPGERDVGLI